MPSRKALLEVLQAEVVGCERCPRLREHCRHIAEVKRRAYLDWEYWGKPVPSLGRHDARLLIVGLAPGAHGANRTGRMFTGDSSGDFLYRALYQTGFANQARAESRDDGLRLLDAYITAPVRCAPPQNKPSTEEFAACRPYLERELDLLTRVRVVVALGRLGLNAYLGVLADRGLIPSRAALPFAHGALHRLGEGLPALLCSYHPSRQNTQTKRLTEQMLHQVFAQARALIDAADGDQEAKKSTSG